MPAQAEDIFDAFGHYWPQALFCRCNNFSKKCLKSKIEDIETGP